MSRDSAKLHGLKFYDNGVPCEKGHSPIVRLTVSGSCYFCRVERAEARRKKKEEQAKIKSRFYVHFKRADGTFQIVGPFKSQVTATATYKRMYLAEYGVPCPAHYFAED